MICKVENSLVTPKSIKIENRKERNYRMNDKEKSIEIWTALTAPYVKYTGEFK
jgi:hypothetical protein